MFHMDLHFNPLLCNLFYNSLYLYTNVHLLLEEFTISLKSSLSTRSLCHTVSTRVGVGVGVWYWAQSGSQESKFFRARVGVRVCSPKFSNHVVGVGVPQKNKDSASLVSAAIINVTQTTKQTEYHSDSRNDNLSNEFRWQLSCFGHWFDVIFQLNLHIVGGLLVICSRNS